MIRAYDAIIAAVVNTITYSIVLFGLICCGEVLNDAHSAAGACAIDRMPPQITARCGYALQRLIDRSRQPRNT